MENSLIIITGLVDTLNKGVASNLSDKLAMFLLDVNKLIEYGLEQKEEMILKCGVDYYKKQEKKMLKSTKNYENTVASISYDLYAVDNNYKLFNSTAYSFYVRVDKPLLKSFNNVDSVTQIAFEERDKVLSQKCNYVIDVKTNDANQIVGTILNKLKEVTLWI